MKRNCKAVKSAGGGEGHGSYPYVDKRVEKVGNRTGLAC